MFQGRNNTPLRMALVYALLGVLWALITEEVVENFIPASSAKKILLQTIIGWLFVLASASLIYLILKRYLHSLNKNQRDVAYQAGLTNDVSDALISIDLQFKVVSWNVAAEKLYGWKANEVIGNDLSDFVKTEYPSGQDRQTTLQTLTEYGRWQGEVIHSRKDGSRVPVLASISFVKDENGAKIGMVGINKDMTQSKKMETILRENEERYRNFFENLHETIIIYRAIRNEQGEVVNWLLLDINSVALQIIGRSREELIGRTIGEIFGEAALKNSIAEYIRVLNTGEISIREVSYNKRDFLVSVFRMNDETVVSTGLDISKRKQDERRIHYFARLYATLSQVNQMIVRSKDRQELFESICKIAIDFGEFRLAWIGLVDAKTGIVSLVAESGFEGRRMPFRDINIKEKPFKDGLIGLAWQSGLVEISNDIQVDSRMIYRKETAIQDNYHSAAVVPIHQNGYVIGLLNLYAEDIDFFLVPEEQKLLEEMGLDISFALDNMVLDAERKEAEENLRESEERYHGLFENIQEIFVVQEIVTDDEGRAIDLLFLDVNPAAERFLGKTRNEIIGKTRSQLSGKPDPDGVEMASGVVTTGKPYHMIRYSPGFGGWFESFTYRVSPKVIATLSLNITERKQAEEALLQSEKRFRSLIENALDNISLLAADGTLLWESPATIRTLGYEQNEFEGKNILELVHPDDAEWVILQFSELLSQPRMVRHGTFRVQHSNGTWRWIESTGTNLLDEPSVGAIVINYRDVTEKRATEQALYFSQQQLLSMIREAPVSIAMFDLGMKYLAASQRWIIEYGNGQIDLIGKSHYEVHPDIPERWKDIHQKGLSGETVKNDNDFWVHADGTKNWLRWAVVPWHDGKGRIEGIIISIEDITESRHAEEALKQSEQNYRQLLEHASDGIFISNPQGQYILVNQAACELVGYSREELLSMNITELIAPEDLERQPLRLDELREGKTIILERVLRHKNGTRIDCELSAKMLPDGRFQSLARNITGRKLAEYREQKRTQALELLARGANLSIVLEAIVAIVENDLEDAICSILLLDESKEHLLHGAAPHLPEFYNQAIHGVPVGMAEGSCGTAAYTGRRVIVQDIETHPYWEKYRELARQAGLRACWSQPIFSSSGEVLGTFAIYHTQPFMPGPHEFGSILSTISLASVAIERKRAEQTIREYAISLEKRVEQRTAELVYANRAKDEFLANMSHELRTPLNSVLGFAETLLEGIRGPLDERQEQAVQIIHSSGEHLLELINDILDVSKIEAGKFDIRLEPVNINNLCQSSLNFVKQLAGRKSITVEYLPSASASTMIVDPKRLKQILVNLLNNAVKFTPEKGRVSLEVQADVERSQMRFSVTDTGIGIASEDLLKLFKPFVQLDSSLSRQYEGSGLGLMLVQKLTEMHGGFVEVQTAVDKGSTFTIVLPWQPDANAIKDEGLFVDETEQENIPSSNSNAKQNAEIKILIAEDNETNIMVVKDYLEDRGYQIFVAHHGKEAIEKASEISPDLILMDIQMPEMDGLEATRRLRATPKFATVPIIALTAFAMPGDRERCLEAGANEYLAKPINLKKLINMITILLRK